MHVKSLIDVIEDSLALRDGGLLMSLHSGLYRRGADGVDMKIGPGVSDGCTAAFEIPALQSCHAKRLTRLSLGPDGSLYALINSGSRLVRLRPNGVLSLVAGGTSGGESGDGGLATAALVSCRSLAVGEDGAVYCGGNSTVRRVGLDGIIRRVAGGTGTLAGYGLPAGQSRLGAVVHMAFLRDGSLLLTEASLIAQLRAIGNDGILRCVAGCGSGPLTDGSDARSARLERVAEAIEAADGTLYFTHTMPQPSPSGVVFRRTIRTIDHAGRLGTIAGVGGPECTSTSVQCGVGGPALSANFAPSSLSLGPDHKLFGRTANLVFSLTPDLPSYARSGFVITEADGRTAYRFDAAGRHLETFDADTGVVELTVEHDGDGHLSTLTDRDGLVTRVERDVHGAPLAIVGPYGQRTELSLDASGYLTRIEDPEGGAWIADYDDQGLLLSWTNRNGHQKTLAWETGGLLASVTDAALATTTLTGVTTGTDRAVTLESAGRSRRTRRWLLSACATRCGGRPTVDWRVPRTSGPTRPS